MSAKQSVMGKKNAETVSFSRNIFRDPPSVITYKKHPLARIKKKGGAER